jgi:hypothetical protein
MNYLFNIYENMSANGFIQLYEVTDKHGEGNNRLRTVSLHGWKQT